MVVKVHLSIADEQHLCEALWTHRCLQSETPTDPHNENAALIMILSCFVEPMITHYNCCSSVLFMNPLYASAASISAARCATLGCLKTAWKISSNATAKEPRKHAWIPLETATDTLEHEEVSLQRGTASFESLVKQADIFETSAQTLALWKGSESQVLNAGADTRCERMDDHEIIIWFE